MPKTAQEPEEASLSLTPEHGFKFAQERQKKIWQELLNLDESFGPELARMYHGAVLLLQDNNPEKISLVCHLARELSAILPLYIPGVPISKNPPSHEQTIIQLDKIAQLINSNGSKADNKEEILDVIKQITLSLTQPKQQSSHRDQLSTIVNNHRLLSLRPDYLNDNFIQQWTKIHQYFVKHSHHTELRNKKRSSSTEKILETNWGIFEGLIHRVLVQEPFFNVIEELDTLLSVERPSDKDADVFVRLVIEHEQRRYFFEKCNNPAWLSLLNDRKAFSSPQNQIVKDGYIRFVGWPESRYLARMAALEPRAVFNIIKEITSDNQSVLDDFLDAAINSPLDVSSLYVQEIIKKKWLRNQYNLRLPDKVADLMLKLADGKKSQAALSLANELFNLSIGDNLFEDSEEYSSIRPSAKPYFDEWRFGEILKKKTLSLATTNPLELFKIYLSKLNHALRLEKKASSGEGLYEYSHIWRPNIGRVDRTHEDAKNLLIDAIIVLVRQYEKDLGRIRAFLGMLEKYPHALFIRIRIFIINQYNDEFLKEGEVILRSKDVIQAYNIRREYFVMLRKLFYKASLDVQGEILKMIMEGPNLKKEESQPQDEYMSICSGWRTLYLKPIANELPEPYKSFYQKTVSQYGEPEDDDGEIKIYDRGKSEIPQKDLAALDFSEVMECISTYVEPEDYSSGFSSSGLGMTFFNVVAENPAKFAVGCDRMLELKIRPLYIYQLLNGLQDALIKDKVFGWDSVLTLCSKIVSADAARLTPALSQHEQDWRSVMRIIPHLLAETLGTKKCEIPIHHKDQVWSIISILVEDEEPTLEDEKRDNKGDLDPVTQANSTVRGAALQAVVCYGLWLSRHRNPQLAKTDDRMPDEVKKVLDRHLDTSLDTSLAIHSIYGLKLPNLHYLSSDWVVSRLHKIFPEEDGLRAFLMAAVEGYVFNRVYINVFDAIKSVYWRLIPLLGTVQDRSSYRMADVDRLITQHLMIVYINHPNYDDLIDYFFANAPAKARGNAIEFVGRILSQENSVHPNKTDAANRMRQLWDKRIESAENADVDEIKEFGWWFRNSVLTKEESIDRLLRTLELSKGIVDVTYEVIERLQDYAQEFPLKTICALNAIARADREYNDFSYKKQEYMQIIREVKKSNDIAAVQKANDLINYIGSRGFIEFRELL